MIALTGMGCRLHLTQERVHLLRLEPPPGPHAAMTGHGGANLRQPLLERNAIAEFAEFLGELLHQDLDVTLTQHRWRLAHDYGARTESFDHQAKLF